MLKVSLRYTFEAPPVRNPDAANSSSIHLPSFQILTVRVRVHVLQTTMLVSGLEGHTFQQQLHPRVSNWPSKADEAQNVDCFYSNKVSIHLTDTLNTTKYIFWQLKIFGCPTLYRQLCFMAKANRLGCMSEFRCIIRSTVKTDQRGFRGLTLRKCDSSVEPKNKLSLYVAQRAKWPWKVIN